MRVLRRGPRGLSPIAGLILSSNRRRNGSIDRLTVQVDVRRGLRTPPRTKKEMASSPSSSYCSTAWSARRRDSRHPQRKLAEDARQRHIGARNRVLNRCCLIRGPPRESQVPPTPNGPVPFITLSTVSVGSALPELPPWTRALPAACASWLVMASSLSLQGSCRVGVELHLAAGTTERVVLPLVGGSPVCGGWSDIHVANGIVRCFSCRQLPDQRDGYRRRGARAGRQTALRRTRASVPSEAGDLAAGTGGPSPRGPDVRG